MVHYFKRSSLHRTHELCNMHEYSSGMVRLGQRTKLECTGDSHNFVSRYLIFVGVYKYT